MKRDKQPTYCRSTAVDTHDVCVFCRRTRHSHNLIKKIFMCPPSHPLPVSLFLTLSLSLSRSLVICLCLIPTQWLALMVVVVVSIVVSLPFVCRNESDFDIPLCLFAVRISLFFRSRSPTFRNFNKFL